MRSQDIDRAVLNVGRVRFGQWEYNCQRGNLESDLPRVPALLPSPKHCLASC